MQSKKDSLIEAIVNTAIEFTINVLITPLFYLIAGIETSYFKMGIVTVLFTVLGVLRGYLVRRFFDFKQNQKIYKNKNMITKLTNYKNSILNENKNTDFANIGTDESGEMLGNCKICGMNGVILQSHIHSTPDPIPNDAPWWTENDIFVFGSNDLGRHNGGAARAAVLYYGAKMGQARGFQGNSYGIVTISFKDDPNIGLISIGNELDTFLDFANKNKDKRFWMTKIGTGISKIPFSDIKKLFIEREIPDNVILPAEFK